MMINNVPRLFLLLLVALTCYTWRATAQEAHTVVTVAGRQVSLTDNATRWLDSFSRTPSGTVLALVRFKMGHNPAGVSDRSNGLHIVSYLSEGVYLTTIDRQQAVQASDLLSVLPLNDAWKISPALMSGHTSQAQTMVDVLISFLPDLSDIDARSLITAAGGMVKPSPMSAYRYYEASVPAGKLKSLADAYKVIYIGEAAHDVTLNLESARAAKASVARAPRSSGGWNLLGDSVTVGVGDNVSGLGHIDLRDRIINFNPSPYTNHGQHTNGTVGGAGTIDPRAEGFAPHVQLVDHLYNLVWERTGAMLQAYNMTVTNNSYANKVGSCTDAGVYDIYSTALDSMALRYPEVLHVFASGNDGGMTCAPFPTAYATVTGGYQAAKNVLVVGNITKQYVPNPGTSRGPIKDGRLKPEISSVGSGVYSTGGGGNNRYQSASGTSMACPQISGSAALLQQRYKQIHGGAYPSSALTKALLMNGALDLGIPGPDFTYGFGIADLTRSLTMIDSNRHLAATIANGSVQNPITITVPPNTGQLKVMLYWHDLPASPMAGTQLINDLDLTVTDAAGGVQLPFILNPAPASVTTPATRGADHLNNVEQIVIDNPSAGTYAVNISGYNVVSGTQDYTVVYDLMPSGITLSTPIEGEAFKSGDWLNFYWNASPGTNTFTVEFTDNNGSTWTTLSSAVAATERQYLWMATAGYNSATCRLRVTRNGTGEQATSGLFVMNTQSPLRLSAVQCPGYVNLHWAPVPNATGYVVLRKSGYYLQPVATVADTVFSAGGLNPDSNYYFSMQPVFGSAKGYRSLAINRIPSDGSCAGTFSDGDLMAARIVAPVTGRLNTSSALSSSETISVEVRNLDDALVASYRVACQVNGGAWSAQTLNNLTAGGIATAGFPGVNMAAPGVYVIRAAVSNLTMADPISRNDTIVRVIRQLQNAPVNLAAGLIEGFETTSRLTLQGDSSGFSNNERWDYFNSNDTGRLRTFVDSEVVISGSRSVTMDLNQAWAPTLNRLTGTFNLAGTSMTGDEVRMEFDYRIHGTPKTADSNRVWIRGSDTSRWIPLFDYNLSAPTGAVLNSGTLSVNDALSSSGQSFTSSTQIAFGQRDTSVVAQNDYGNGLTLDNVKLYKVLNDAGIAGVVSPAVSSCALGATTPLTITVYNGVTSAISNIYLYYQLDGGTVVRDTIASLAGKASIPFTFTELLAAAEPGQHVLNVWLTTQNDSYSANDSLIGYLFRNEPLIEQYPYLEDFERGDGYWYTGGANSSWAFGTPASKRIHKAASGRNAWKTSLTGNYNDNELSYLYSPCFDVSALTSPMLSFSSARHIENCGSIFCDGAWVEYSVDNGATWAKLGAKGQGTNWYDTSSYQVWNTDTPVRWQVSSIPLPQSLQPLRIRFVMSSDPGAAYEGIAVDDIHLFDRVHSLYTGGPISAVTQNVSGTGLSTFLAAGAVAAQMSAGGSSLGNTTVKLYTHDSFFDKGALQYFLPRSFVVQTQTKPVNTVLTRLYIPDTDVVRLLAANECDDCSKPEDAYSLGVTKFDHQNKSLENGSLSDNAGGSYTFIPADQIRWVPYDAGYYAEMNLTSFSELWFNGGGPATFALTQPALDFTAKKAGENTALLSWSSRSDTAVMSYGILRGTEVSNLVTTDSVQSIKNNGHTYTYTDAPGVVRSQALYYRLRFRTNNGGIFYTAIRQVVWSGRTAALQISPNPVSDGRIVVRWSALPGAVLDLRITDAAGRHVKTAITTAGGFSNEMEINLGDALSKGVYFVHAMIGDERFYTKLLVL